MPVSLVPDPTYVGKETAPLMVKAHAMRKLHEAGKSVSEVALYFGVTYHNAYKAINPRRQHARSEKSTVAKPLTPGRASQLTKRQLIAIATSKAKTEVDKKRIQSAADEMDRRDPDWINKL